MGALLAILLTTLVLLPNRATASPPGHRLGPVRGDFWTSARIQRALGSDSMRHRRVPAATGAAASSLNVFDASAPEDRTNGRIFAIDPRRGPYSCSGTSLDTPSGSIVITAGHCVLEAGSWGTEIVFVPAYDHEERPFGTFFATEAFVTRPWQRSNNSDFDVAALLVEPNEFGSLAGTVGAKGWASSRSRYLPLQIFGYPAAALGGEELRSCASKGLGSDRLTNFYGGPPTLPARCDMAGGSSGGAWLVDGELVDGVTSYGYTSDHSRLYSPYFGPAIDHFLSQLP